MSPASQQREKAQACLVACAAHLSLSVVQGSDFDMWRSVLAECLTHTRPCRAQLAGIVSAVEELVAAKDAAARRAALDYLRLETVRYYRLAAAQRHEIFVASKVEATPREAS